MRVSSGSCDYFGAFSRIRDPELPRIDIPGRYLPPQNILDKG